MKTQLAMSDLILIAVTRGMLGAGLGLLLAGRLAEPQRRPLGWGLLAIGLLTTPPLALRVFGGVQRPPASRARAKPRTGPRPVT